MKKRMLIKVGTASLMKNDRLDQAIFDNVAGQIAGIINLDFEVALITSAAIKAGEEEAKKLGLDVENLHKKDLAGLGSVRLMNFWREAFTKHGIGVAQVWVTHSNLTNKYERASIKSSSDNFARAGIVTILDENDVVSPREISLMFRGISENDQLTRLFAQIFKPDLIANITLAGGIYEKDPAKYPDARIYRELNCRNLPKGIILKNGKSEAGSGGAGNKIAEMAGCCFDCRFLWWKWHRNCRQVRIIGLADNALIRFAKGGETGTLLGRQNRF